MMTFTGISYNNVLASVHYYLVSVLSTFNVVHIAQSFNKRRPEIVTLPYKTWAHKIMAHPKWAPKKTQPSPKIYQPSPPNS